MIQVSDSSHLNFSFWGFRPCTDFSDAVCEPYDWLIHGTGKAPFLIRIWGASGNSRGLLVEILMGLFQGSVKVNQSMGRGLKRCHQRLPVSRSSLICRPSRLCTWGTWNFSRLGRESLVRNDLRPSDLGTSQHDGCKVPRFILGASILPG